MTFGFGGDSPRTKLSAEERLLEVIQKGGEAHVPFQGKRLFGGFYEKIRSTFGQRDSGSGRKRNGGSRLGQVNKALGVVVILGLGLSTLNVFYFKPDVGRMQGLVAEAAVPEAPADLGSIPVEEVLASIRGRSLFQPKAEEAPPAAPPPPAGSAPAVLENLQLVGIAWGAQPEAMIRDKQEGRTYFLKVGETWKDVLVKEILKDRVIVEYAGETREIL